MKRAFAYVRSAGNAGQEDLIRGFCEQTGRHVARVFLDHTPLDALSGDVCMLHEMTYLARLLEADVVIHNCNAVAHDSYHWHIFLDRAGQRGVRVFNAFGIEYSTTTEATRWRQSFFRWDTTLLVRRLEQGRRRKAYLTGGFCGGRKAYANQAALELIRHFTDEGWSVRRIARELLLQGFTPPKQASAWSPSTIHKLQRRLAAEKR